MSLAFVVSSGCGGENKLESTQDGSGGQLSTGGSELESSGGSSSTGGDGASGGVGASGGDGTGGAIAAGGTSDTGGSGTGGKSGAGDGIAGGLNCDASQATTDELIEACPQSQLRSIVAGQWDECVPLNACGCDTPGQQSQCGDGLSYICRQGNRCGDLVR